MEDATVTLSILPAGFITDVCIDAGGVRWTSNLYKHQRNAEHAAKEYCEPRGLHVSKLIIKQYDAGGKLIGYNA